MTEAGLAGMDEPPDLIVVANDDMALGAIEAAKASGHDIPVIGFDALPEALASIRATSSPPTGLPPQLQQILDALGQALR